MPGLFGIYSKIPHQDLSPKLLSKMGDSMRHTERLKVEYRNLPRFGAGRVHLGILQPHSQPEASLDRRYFLWLAGEIYNRLELCQLFGLPETPVRDAQLVLALYERAGWDFLREIDGVFALALYDSEKHNLHLVTDRYGLRPIYWWENRNVFAFGAEVKALLTLPDVSPHIDREAVSEFFSFGVLLENRTWLEKIWLVPPAALFTISSKGDELSRYWSWSDLQPLPRDAFEEDIVEELGRLWLQAVRRRVDDKRIGVLLSGGLDSRAVLAAIPSKHRPIHAVTFGIPGCDDHRIARRVAALKGARHHFLEIGKGDWLKERFQGVSWTDGELNLMHMPGIEVRHMMPEYFDVVLSGAWGGGVLVSGRYHFELAQAPWYISKLRKNNNLIDPRKQKEVVARYLAFVRRLGSAHALYIQQELRRLTLCGLLLLANYVENRLPFADKDFLEFVFRIPLRYKLDSSIYKKMLLRLFPEFYQDIPWQKTGVPITANDLRVHFSKLMRIGIYTMSKLGLHYKHWPDFTDYNRWMRADPARKQIQQILLNPEALYREYLPASEVIAIVRKHMEGRANYEVLSLLLTFEIYLQQILAGD